MCIRDRINALHERYVETGCPKNLTLWHSTGLGDRNDRGMSPLALEGLVKRVIGGHWGQSPRLAEMASENKIEAYNFPQGIMAQLARTAAAGQPGILSHVGLGTFIDPRVSGGKLNEVTKEDLIKVMNVDGKEWLYYPVVPLDVCLIRATTADTDCLLYTSACLVYHRLNDRRRCSSRCRYGDAVNVYAAGKILVLPAGRLCVGSLSEGTGAWYCGNRTCRGI